jgi:hypothetical protein
MDAEIVPMARRKRPRRESPTQRSLKHLRATGALAEVVERRLPKVFITKDLFGFIDIVALVGAGTVGVQTTSGDNVAARLDKMRSPEIAPNVRRWLEAGNAVVIHGWRKAGPRGKRKLWTLREVVVTAADLDVRRVLQP